jgi:hypothetical protein
MNNQWIVYDHNNYEAWGTYPSKDAAEKAVKDFTISQMRAEGCGKEEIDNYLDNDYWMDDFNIVILSGPRTYEEREQSRLQEQIDKAQKQLLELKAKQGGINAIRS